MAEINLHPDDTVMSGLEGLIKESGDETWAEKEGNWWSKEDN